MMSKKETSSKDRNSNTSKIAYSSLLPAMHEGKEGIKQLYDGKQEKAGSPSGGK